MATTPSLAGGSTARRLDPCQPATRRLVRALGLVVAATGAEHGVGEILQGNRPLTGPVIQSWPDSRFFRIENGEPAFTLLPHPVAAGTLTLIVAAAFAGRTWFSDRGVRPRSDLIGLSVVMFLVGGGFGPPLLGLALAIPAGWVRRRPSERQARWWGPLGASSGWLLAAAIGGWLALVPGLPVLDVVVGVGDGWILPLFLVAAVTSAAATVAARARDSGPTERGQVMSTTARRREGMEG